MASGGCRTWLGLGTEGVAGDGVTAHPLTPYFSTYQQLCAATLVRLVLVEKPGGSEAGAYEHVGEARE